MEYDRIHEQAALHSAVTPLNRQGIINDILKISLEPFLFQELLERILSYIVSRKQLRLAGRAAIFLIDPDSERLIMKASLGLTDQQRESCANDTFRECHCGMAASSGTIHFFSQPPPRQSPCSPSTGYTSHYCVPILHDATAVGVLTLYVTPDHELSVNMEQLLESIANILATVIESQKMDQQLIELVNDLRVSIINLREEKLFTESVIQSLNHGLLVVDMQGVILKSNPMSRQILQPFARNLDGRNLHELLGWETARRMLLIPAEGEARRERDIILQAQSGESRVVSCVTTSRQDTRGRQVGVIIAVTDVTELRYVHKEMEKMNRLSTVAEIASAVAHEVRNPLAGIKIMAQSIEEDATDGEQLECSRRIIRQGCQDIGVFARAHQYAVCVEGAPCSRLAVECEVLDRRQPFDELVFDAWPGKGLEHHPVLLRADEGAAVQATIKTCCLEGCGAMGQPVQGISLVGRVAGILLADPEAAAAQRIVERVARRLQDLQ